MTLRRRLSQQMKNACGHVRRFQSHPATSLEGWYAAQVSRGEIEIDKSYEEVIPYFGKLVSRVESYLPRLHEYRKQVRQYWTERAALDADNEQERPTKNGYPAGSAPPSNHATQEPAPPQVPRGIYLHGPVGTGKSMIMDRFCHSLQQLVASDSPGTTDAGSTGVGEAQAAEMLGDTLFWSRHSPVRRMHFHAFMLEVHRRIHTLKHQQLEQHGRNWHVDTRQSSDAVVQVGRQMGQLFPVLCLDEFQVADVADAVILSRLFGAMWREGLVLVATSNRAPAGLYEGGLNRDDFLPFIEALERRSRPLQLTGERDYRMHSRGDRAGRGDQGQASAMQGGDSGALLGTTGGAAADQDIEFPKSGLLLQRNASSQASLLQLVSSAAVRLGAEGKSAHSALASGVLDPAGVDWSNEAVPPRYLGDPTWGALCGIQIKGGRRAWVQLPDNRVGGPVQAPGAAVAHFEDLCGRALGAVDYAGIFSSASLLCLRGVPLLTEKRVDAARRFVTLVDEAYEAGVVLVLESDGSPGAILEDFRRGSEALGSSAAASDDTGSTVTADPAGSIVASAAAAEAGENELRFACARAVSRLTEMLRPEYLTSKRRAEARHRSR